MNSRAALRDSFFLTLVLLLSAMLYVHRLGWYSDDWVFLQIFSSASDQSLSGLFDSVYTAQPWARVRPAQLLYLSALYWLFGLDPLYSHLVNLLVLNLATVIFYLSLLRLGQPRLLSLTLPLVYALLPHYSTDRFWYSAFQANLSMALYFLNLYSNLRAVQSRRKLRALAWASLAAICLCVGVLAYEVVLPLFLFNFVLLWPGGRQADGRLKKIVLPILLASQLIGLAVLTQFKAASERTHQGGILDQLLSYDYSRNIKAGLVTHFGSYGVAMPRKLFRILRDYPDATILLSAALLGLLIFLYLRRVADISESDPPGNYEWVRLIPLGLIVFGLGYCVFLGVGNISFSTTGISNRTAIAAALGVAMCFVGSVGLFTSVLRTAAMRRVAFCLLAALLCVAGFVINNTIGGFWAAAYNREREVINDIQSAFCTIPEGSTLMLDGVCPYIGPAIVFDNQWDLEAALRIAYSAPSIRADIVRPNLEVGDEGLSTSSYGVWKALHPYGDGLIVYHYGQKKKYIMKDAHTAREYFEVNKTLCPEGREGYGVKAF